NAAIDGAITFFGWVLTGAIGVYSYLCKDSWLAFFGRSVGSLGTGLVNCAYAGIALLLLNYGYAVLNTYGQRNTWVYDS
ncbi:hypothetical protein V1509DRAFT_557908, partial [Lipomyces kononenkoae]